VVRQGDPSAKGHGGQASRKGRSWNLGWPDGAEMASVVFSTRDAAAVPAAQHLTLESPSIRELVAQLPMFVHRGSCKTPRNAAPGGLRRGVFCKVKRPAAHRGQA